MRILTFDAPREYTPEVAKIFLAIVTVFDVAVLLAMGVGLVITGVF